MEGALGKKAMQAMGKCKGRRPWLEVGDDSCDALPRTVQRGASNVWFSVSRSAISIPPWSDGAFRVLDRHWTVLKVVPEVSLREVLLSVVPKSGDYDVDDLLMATLERRRQESGEATEHSLKEQEYEALRRGRPERDRTQEFVCVPATAPGTTAGSWFPMIQQVTRLREVRALQGFTRLSPPGGSAEKLQERMAPLSQSDLGWLPAIEVTGEGVYFDLASTRLSTWEQSPLVEQRLRPLIDRHKKVLGVDGVDAVTPRKVLLHTLAHVLIDQWALECGYPNASLAERLYVSAEMAGFLVYTATTDSAGSLGGVVAMTENGRLDASLREALQRIAWCSADPLCIEAGGHGVDSLNLAACHSCVLLPETSCEERNLFLDRAVLVGTLEDPDLGYFADLVRT
jgi:hypothetical protein